MEEKFGFQQNKTETGELRFLGSVKGSTQLDRIHNEEIRTELNIKCGRRD